MARLYGREVPLNTFDTASKAAFALALAVTPFNGLSDAATVERGRELFTTWSCGACHVLSDAGAAGPVGPSLDHNPNLNKEFLINRITNGQGAMPPFGGQMTEEEIADVAAYIMLVTAK